MPLKVNFADFRSPKKEAVTNCHQSACLSTNKIDGHVYCLHLYCIDIRHTVNALALSHDAEPIVIESPSHAIA